ncbi:c-type cytochrome biogenesis protein CcsB [Tessaracoccus lapidicaptus]|uniref:C-type cytochrome biogenesis protein CcsB n=1 Tax=Tessaracoccus lapidicaptus TaxID=1427523 RepID=A0A1C0ARB3_9ACTN|nr:MULTISPECIES: c-type cytochrome biogenesis protein CcsB [Tessaracoccus]AQX16374.1 c-type cytochrome biogenesis protein CcsB [Tessaracoccus sp. T2.5-30]OCL36812.1 c-type cytochrome biogenesis protein CcsB [Tessaracoccus lapidicaptus]VEP41001.1 Cytochrome c biogenesis protein CcsA [Tessaracoccus lapidicaptus]
MTLSEWSYTVMVYATVGYLLAFAMHALEWSAARGLAPARPADGSEDAQRLRVDQWGRFGVAATVLAAVLHISAVVLRGVAAERPPWGNMYEFITSALAFAVLIHLVAVARFGMRWLGLGLTLLYSIGLGVAVTQFYVEVSPLVPALHSVWFIIHIVAAAIAGAAFNVGAVASALYLARDAAERRAESRGVPLTGYLAKLPSARTLDLVSYRLHAFAVPLWTFTIAAGAIWAQYAWGRFWNWDPKETWSFITWIVYVAYLHARATAGWRGRPVAIIALIGLVTFWFNFIGVNLLFSGLHSYAGI